jgi:photosystem II stability/assembly factor-like uncharacterized protein
MKKIIILFLFICLLVIPTIVQAQWIQTNGPFGGSANALTSNGDKIFACLNGNVFFSTDNGTSWNPTVLINQAVNSIMSGNGNLFALTGGLGIFLSTDDGVSWNTINNGLTPYLRVNTLLAVGTNLFTSTQGGTSRNRINKVYRSTDNGKNWTSSDNGLLNSKVNTFVSCVPKTKETNIFAGSESGVFHSTDFGDSWQSIGLSNINVSALAIISDSTNIACIIAGTNNGIYRSTNGGIIWEHTNSGLSDTLISVLAIKPGNSEGTNIFTGTEGGSVYLSTNNGINWKSISTGLIAGSWNGGAGIHSLTFVGPILFACTDAGIFLSTNYGKSWQPSNNGIQDVTVNTLITLPAKEGNTRIFAGTFPSGIFMSTNNGDNWTAFNNGINSINCNALIAKNGDIFAGTSSGIFHSTYYGSTWTYSGLENNAPVISFCLVPNNNGETNILAGTWYGNFISSNGGSTWNKIGLDHEITAAIIDSNSAGGINIFAGTNGSGIFLSTDNGITWNSLHNGIPTMTTIYALAFSGTNLFAAAGYIVYSSSDNGMSWSPTGLNTYVTSEYTYITSLVTSSRGSKSSTIFAGSNSLGVFASTDNGVTWQSANLGLSNLGICSLAVSELYLFAGTNRAGIWRRPLSELTSIQEKPSGQIPEYFSLSQNYPNPFNPTTRINYQLPLFSKVSIKVFDILGREIATLVNEEKPAGNYTILFDGNKLTSGVYLYQLKAGEHVITRKFVLLK